jgi:CRP-like cAMP-binding protein
MTLTENRTDKPALLSRNWLLGHLSGAELDKLAHYARFQRFQHKDVIFRKGDLGQSMLVVVRGSVRITSHSVSGTEKEVVLNIINPGDIVGEIALLDGELRTADAVAIGDVELLVLSRRDFLPFLERHSEVCIKLLTLLCQRLRKTSDQVEDLVFLDQPARLAKTLLRLAECNETSADQPGKSCVDLKLTQSEIGALAGLRREAVNRQLHQWCTDGIVSLDHGRIWIEQLDALEDIAADPI